MPLLANFLHSLLVKQKWENWSIFSMEYGHSTTA